MLKQIIAFFLQWLNKAREARDHGLSDFERVRYEIRPCDVLLIEGSSKADKVIQNISQSPWSHAALYVGRPLDIGDSDLKTIIGHFFDGAPDTPLLIESKLGEGIVVKPLDSYEHEHLRICRPKSLNEKDAGQVIRFAVNRLGAHKGGSYLFDLFRFFFPWSLLPVAWRGAGFRHWAGRHTKNVTAAFIAECFGFIQFPVYPLVKTTGEQGVQLLRRHPKLCMPFEIDQSPNFEIIKYPFIDFKIYEHERLIPWKGSGVYSGMEQDPALVFKSGDDLIKKSEDENNKVTAINAHNDQ
jgi:hypothetical protein